MEVTDDEREDCRVVNKQVERAIGKTVTHTRDEHAVYLTLENTREDHPLLIESESQDTSINNVKTSNSDKNCLTVSTGDIEIQTSRSSTDCSVDNICTVNDIEMKTINMVVCLDPEDKDSQIHDGPIWNSKTIKPLRDDENTTTKLIENCVTTDATTLYVRTNIEDAIDECRNGVNNKEATYDLDEVDGLRRVVKQTVETLISCASSKEMTVDEDNRPFEKATKENAHEHGAVTSVKRPMYDKDIEIKTRVTAVLEKVEMVSQCNVSIKESCNQASTVFTSELTEDKTEKCRFSLPSKGEEKVNSFEQISQKSNAICTKNDILLVDPYDFSRSHQGYMVIIVNQTFKHQAFRDGAFKDIEYLYNIAYKLCLNVYKGQNTNLSLSETLQLLENVRTLDHSHCNMLAVAFSTHGLEQPNPKAKGKSDHALVCADDRLIFTSTVTEIFNDDNCPSLKDKPKLFIIQACRGEEHDNGADLWVTKKTGVDRTCGGYADNCWQTSLETPDVHFTNDSWAGGPDNQGQSAHLLDDHTITPASPMVTQIQSAQLLRAPLRSSPKLKPFPLVDTPSLKCENDQLIFYAIPPGMFAWRNTEDGSWMLYYLNNLIEMCDERRPINMLKLLLKVNAEMALRTTNVPSDKNLDRKKAISVVEHKLTRDLIFPSRVK